MRNVNVVKYRKLLQKLQFFCKTNKSNLWSLFTAKRYLTDYENGYIAGQHAAYNKVLREVESMMFRAEDDWNSMHCREEQSNN